MQKKLRLQKMFHLKRQLNLAKRFLIVFSNISGLATQETFSNKIARTRLSSGLCIFSPSIGTQGCVPKSTQSCGPQGCVPGLSLYSHAEHGAFGVVVE